MRSTVVLPACLALCASAATTPSNKCKAGVNILLVPLLQPYAPAQSFCTKKYPPATTTNTATPTTVVETITAPVLISTETITAPAVLQTVITTVATVTNTVTVPAAQRAVKARTPAKADPKAAQWSSLASKAGAALSTFCSCIVKHPQTTITPTVISKTTTTPLSTVTVTTVPIVLTTVEATATEVSTVTATPTPTRRVALCPNGDTQNGNTGPSRGCLDGCLCDNYINGGGVCNNDFNCGPSCNSDDDCAIDRVCVTNSGCNLPGGRTCSTIGNCAGPAARARMMFARGSGLEREVEMERRARKNYKIKTKPGSG